MTAIDLTRDQCAALADFLRRTVDRGMDSGYDEIELLVLAQRALRNASKPIGLALVCDVPKSGTPEGGGTVSAVREVAPARPSGASEAARFKRETADRLVAYRSKWGPGCMGRLAALCGGDVNAKGDANMDYTKGCIDRELERIMGSAFQPWEVRYPEKVFGGK